MNEEEEGKRERNELLGCCQHCCRRVGVSCFIHRTRVTAATRRRRRSSRLEHRIICDEKPTVFVFFSSSSSLTCSSSCGRSISPPPSCGSEKEKPRDPYQSAEISDECFREIFQKGFFSLPSCFHFLFCFLEGEGIVSKKEINR